MARFQFQFAALMSLRRNRRDLCRQMLAGALLEDDALKVKRDQLHQSRQEQLLDLKQRGRPGEVDVPAAAARRYYAGRLLGELGLVDRQRQVVSQQIAACRQALIAADQQVRVLERLEERGRDEFQYVEQRRENLALEDTWFAQNARSAS